MLRLLGKAAMITGAARGLGRACAIAFAREGADLILLDIAQDVPGVPYPLASKAQLDESARLCEDHGAAAVALKTDVRDMAAVTRAVTAARERFGRIDVLVNNAGIAAPAGKAAHEISEAEWDLIIDIDLSGAWRMTKAVGQIMLDQRCGSIINVSATAGQVGYRNFAGYVTVKHGLIGLTRAAAFDYAQRDVRVNALCPGFIRDEPSLDCMLLSEISRIPDGPIAVCGNDLLQPHPIESLVEPDDVAAAAIWLASDESRRVTGSLLTVDGGFTAR
jgi:NAD(P)-dependent dehydrogenase (short-subunit alcohol dehydrogenase family)